MACKHFHKITGLTASATASTLTATFETAVTVSNEGRICFKLDTTVPAGSSGYAVLLTLNGATAALLDKYGNPMTGADLISGKLYCCYYGSTVPNVVAFNYPVKKCTCGC